MAYVATCNWVDLQDNRHRYLTGDKFPREGLAVSAARLKYLAGTENPARKPLIRTDGEEAVVNATKTRVKTAEKTVNAKPKATRKTAPRAKRAVKNDA